MTNNDYLAHHGIKGQKWGVRRFQNEDGSLTSAGRKKNGINNTDNANKKDSAQPVKRKGLSAKAKAWLTIAGIATTYAAASYLSEYGPDFLQEVKHLGQKVNVGIGRKIYNRQHRGRIGKTPAFVRSVSGVKLRNIKATVI